MRRNPADRFWRKVDKSAGPGACWLWRGGMGARGYGAFQMTVDGRKTRTAHRASWALAHGPIPEGLHVLHRCDNDAKGRGGYPSGEAHSMAKLTVVRVVELRARYAAGESFCALAAAFGIDRAAARHAVHGDSWAGVPGAVPADEARRQSGRSRIRRAAEKAAAARAGLGA